MIVYFPDSAVFHDSAAFGLVRRVVQSWEEGQHRLHVVDADGLLSSPFWKNEVPESQRAELSTFLTALLDDVANTRRAVDLGARPVAPHVEIRQHAMPVDGSCLWSLSPEDAARWVRESLVLLLENDDDFVLLKAVARVYGETWLADAVSNGWLRINGRGGNDQVRKTLERAGAFDRLFVFVDSDREVAGATVKQNPQGLIVARCAELRPPVPCFLTAARECENYIPDRFIDQAGARTTAEPARTFYQRWRAATPEERRHLKLKKGGFGDQWIKPIFQGLDKVPDLASADFDGCGGAELRDILRAIQEYL